LNEKDNMTKLVQWLVFLAVFASVWFAYFLPIEPLKDSDPNVKEIVFWSPLVFILAFGLISIAIIFYRVATFNDCKEAADELKRQIDEARADLSSKGLQF